MKKKIAEEEINTQGTVAAVGKLLKSKRDKSKAKKIIKIIEGRDARQNNEEGSKKLREKVKNYHRSEKRLEVKKMIKKF